jgi:carbonic anhydrase
MRLFEAVLDANQRKIAGDKNASVPAAEFGPALPVAALTCIDARLNHLLPEMLGIPEEQFIWLRNAGNIVTGPLSSTLRSLALACAIKGAKEIAIIGHSDCLVGKATAMKLLDGLAALGVDRNRLPANLVEYFGLFATERQNVMRGVDFVRTSPLIGPKVPVHGLLIDIQSGRLEWIVNGYQGLESVAGKSGQVFRKVESALDAFGQIGSLAAGELQFPQSKIGELTKTAHDWLHKAEQVAGAVEEKLGQPPAVKPAEPPPLPRGSARARPK